MTKTKQAVDWGAKQLKYSFSPRLDAEVLLAYVLNLDRADVLARPDLNTVSAQLKKYQELIQQRAGATPVAYLVGTKEFFGLPFYVNRAVLIPRPETEAMVERAIEIIGEKRVRIIYDIGTGSGNIAIALAKHLSKVKVVASDICQRALKVAHQNIRSYKLGHRIELIHSNLAEHIKTADLIVANLPYVPKRYQVSKDILFEPKLALFAGEDGLDLYRQLFKSALFETFQGTCLIELGVRQFESMTNWLKQHLPQSQASPITNIDGEICGLEIDFSQSPA